MPNWVFNRLLVHGAAADRREFQRWNAGHQARYVAAPWQLELELPAERIDLGRLVPLSFHALVPVPPEVLAAGEEAVEGWQTAHWGTRCNAKETAVHDDGETLIYEFMTPWSAPARWFLAVAERFPHLTLTLEYLEPSWILAGRLSIADGQSVEEWEASSQDEISAFGLESFGWDPYASDGGDDAVGP